MTESDDDNPVVHDFLEYAERAHAPHAMYIRQAYRSSKKQTPRIHGHSQDVETLINAGTSAISELHDALYFSSPESGDIADAIVKAKCVLSKMINHIDKGNGPNRSLIKPILGCGTTSLSFRLPPNDVRLEPSRQIQTTSIGRIS